jgi:GMP synthase (glutamine-hydrolysing)
MAPAYDQLRVRLIQIRLEPAILEEEQQTFLDRCLLAPHQMVVSNAIRDRLESSLLRNVDAVLIGGAGAFSATQDYTWMPNLTHLIEVIYDEGIPLFGSCWGHQYIARVFGGRVINDPDRSEMGCHSVRLTEAGSADELLKDFPPVFKANMGHQDRVSLLPDGAVELATNGTAPFQAFRMKDRPIYGTQFHSELNAEAERARLYEYRDHYPLMKDETSFQSVLDSLAETTEVDSLLPRFLNQFAVQ